LTVTNLAMLGVGHSPTLQSCTPMPFFKNQRMSKAKLIQRQCYFYSYIHELVRNLSCVFANQTRIDILYIPAMNWTRKRAQIWNCRIECKRSSPVL